MDVVQKRQTANVNRKEGRMLHERGYQNRLILKKLINKVIREVSVVCSEKCPLCVHLFGEVAVACPSPKKNWTQQKRV